MVLLGDLKIKRSNDENGESVPHLQITEAVLIHCNNVDNDYQHDLRVLYTFVLNKLFRQLLDISTKKLLFLKTFSSEVSCILIKVVNH